MSIYRVTVDGQTYDVEIENPATRPVRARIDGEWFQVEVERPSVAPSVGKSAAQNTPPPSLAPQVSSPAPVASTNGRRALTAPIPGKVVTVTATVGQNVERGDALLTIEAMKMFNVIRSPWAGVVLEVQTSEGKRVSQGEALLILSAVSSA